MVGLNKIVEINGFYNVIKPIMPIVDNVQHSSLTSLLGKIVLYGIGIVIFIVVIFVVYQFIKCVVHLNKKSKKNKQYNDVQKCVEFIKKNKEASELKTNDIPLV